MPVRIGFLALDMPPVTAVRPVAPMHEHVKQRAGHKQQEGKETEDVRPVFRKKEKGGDCQEGNGGEPHLRSPKPGRFWLELRLRSMPDGVISRILYLRVHVFGSFHCWFEQEY